MFFNTADFCFLPTVSLYDTDTPCVCLVQKHETQNKDKNQVYDLFRWFNQEHTVVSLMHILFGSAMYWCCYTKAPVFMHLFV